MNILGESFRHFASSDVGDGMEGQTVVNLVVRVQVFPDRVDHQPEEVRVLMHQQSHGKVALEAPVR